MYKIFMAALLAIVVLALGCGETTDTDTPPAKPVKEGPAAEPGEGKVDALIKEFKTQADEERRKTIVDELDKIGSEKALAAIRSALEDESPSVRMAAVAALWDKGDKQAVGPLIELLKDEDQTIRMYVVDVLQELTGQEFGKDYDKWKEWHEASQGK